MAASYSCDGCGANVTKPNVVGRVIKREYCTDCAIVALAFIESEEKLRRDTQEAFIDARAKMIANAPADFKLPDVP